MKAFLYLDETFLGELSPDRASALDHGDFMADAPFYRYTKAEAEARYAAIEEICRGF